MNPTNKYMPHLHVLPEDDANRQIAGGFILHHAVQDTRVHVAAPAGGWSHVRDVFVKEYVPLLRRYSGYHVVLLVDFDDHCADRRNHFDEHIPDDVRERVFVVGAKFNPEDLRKELAASFERIGELLAEDCYHGTTEVWGHEHLSHNDADRTRLVAVVKPFLFA